MKRDPVRYEDLPSGTFFRLVAVPDRRFFKCEPWVSTTEDLEKFIQFKPDTMVVNDDRVKGGEEQWLRAETTK